MTEVSSIKEALERSIVAIDDWLNVYASDLCNQDRVDEANHRISNAGGTLVYIASVQQQNRAALATLQPSGEQREAIARIICYWDEPSTCHDNYCVFSCRAKTPDARFFKAADAILASGLVQNEADIRADCVSVSRDVLLTLISVLDCALGDTDPSIDEDCTDDEIKRDYPVFWVCRRLVAIRSARFIS